MNHRRAVISAKALRQNEAQWVVQTPAAFPLQAVLFAQLVVAGISVVQVGAHTAYQAATFGVTAVQHFVPFWRAFLNNAAVENTANGDRLGTP